MNGLFGGLSKSILNARDVLGNFVNLTSLSPSSIINSLAVTSVAKTDPVFMNWFTETNQDSAATTTAPTVKEQYTVTLDDVSEYAVGKNFLMLSPLVSAIYRAFILDITGNTLTLDTPMNEVFPTGSRTISGSAEMNIDGSTTPKIFSIRGILPIPEPSLEIIIHRILLTCYTSNAVSLSKFGDIVDGLTRGLVLRQANGVTTNTFNVKDNGEIGSFCYDWTPLSADNPAQDVNGFLVRMTFGGDSKMGTTIPLQENESLEFVVQDPLQTLLKLRGVAEGSIRFLS